MWDASLSPPPPLESRRGPQGGKENEKEKEKKRGRELERVRGGDPWRERKIKGKGKENGKEMG